MIDFKEQRVLDIELDEQQPEMLPQAPLQAFANAFDDPDLRSKVMAMEAFMLQQEQVPIPVRHIFSKGLYAREITAPAGVIMTGKVHKTEHLNIMSKGEVSVLTENGIERLKAPCTFVSKPGTKRIGYVHEEMVWTTVHVTEETDIEKLEAELTTDGQNQLEIERLMLSMKES